MTTTRGTHTGELGANIIGVMAGKGGVGKTVLSCNLARVAVIDLDLYNRGATALLMGEPASAGADSVYSLLERSFGSQNGAGPGSPIDDVNLDQVREHAAQVKLHEVDDNLFLLPSSPTAKVIKRLEYNLSPNAASKFLMEICRALIQNYNLDCVIFDCKAGPDPLALGVVGMANETVLISEYNKVAFDGTLNFYQHIREVYGIAELRTDPLRVVVNKVPEKFDLTKSDALELLSSRFRPLPLLTTLPFEYDVFQAFGESRFVVDDLPESTFAAKIALLAVRLFDQSPVHLSDKITALARHSGRGGPMGYRPKRERVTQFLVLTEAVYALAVLAFGGSEIDLDRLKVLVQDPAMDGAALAGVTGLTAVVSGALVRR